MYLKDVSSFQMSVESKNRNFQKGRKHRKLASVESIIGVNDDPTSEREKKHPWERKQKLVQSNKKKPKTDKHAFEQVKISNF